MNKRPKKSEKESRGRNLVPKRSLNDMTNNFSSRNQHKLKDFLIFLMILKSYLSQILTKSYDKC